MSINRTYQCNVKRIIPFPALNSGQSSRTTTVAYTASKLLPPASKIFIPSYIASFRALDIYYSRSGFIEAFVITPQPPCMAIENLVVVSIIIYLF
jgi:hypothetical protein